MTKKTETIATKSGTEIFVPLNKLKKSPNNARKTPHGNAAIEALAASIAVKGMLQNLVVEPERDADGAETGFYFVTVGEGRRQAQLLRVKRKQIKKTELIRCLLDTAHDPHEISLDENVTRTAMHPADQFEAFRRLSDERGLGAEEIAARFGVTAQVVRQRLRLAAVSPRLMEIYRAGDLTLDQLMAFAITDDHVRQEQVYDSLTWNKEPHTIRRKMTEAKVPTTDRRAVFVGAEAYETAGGTILRDLFSAEDAGYFEDAGLLDRLVIEKLGTIVDQAKAEGWKWAQAFIDFPHDHGLSRVYPEPQGLSPEDQERLDTLHGELEALTEQYESAEELPDEIDARCGQIESEIERLSERQYVFAPDMMARSGVFVFLNHDGTANMVRGFVRPEDEEPEADEVQEGRDNQAAASENDETDGSMALSQSLIRDLTAHRTLGLRLALGEHPDVALIAVTHALAAQTFYRGEDSGSCLTISSVSTPLSQHADGIEDAAAAKKLADRHEAWAVQMPTEAEGLWDFVASLDPDRRLSLLAHCVSLTVLAVTQAWDRNPRGLATADKLAAAVSLDMGTHWTPTVPAYLGRVTKMHILAAVSEGVSGEAADRIAGLKKPAMAEAAEKLLAGTGWLPMQMRTPEMTKAV